MSCKICALISCSIMKEYGDHREIDAHRLSGFSGGPISPLFDRLPGRRAETEFILHNRVADVLRGSIGHGQLYLLNCDVRHTAVLPDYRGQYHMSLDVFLPSAPRVFGRRPTLWNDLGTDDRRRIGIRNVPSAVLRACGV